MSGDTSDAVTLYVVAVRRERRDDVAADWVETLRATPGVELLAPAGGAAESRRLRVRVRATTVGEVALRERLGELCHVEPLIAHDASAADADGHDAPPGFVPPSAGSEDTGER